MPKCDLIKLLNFIEVIPWHACSPVNLLHIFRTPFPNNTSGGTASVLIQLEKSPWGVLILSFFTKHLPTTASLQLP